MEEIKNRVAESKLKVFDLEDYFPKEEVIELDISAWLLEGQLLRESDFRTALKEHNWQSHQSQHLALYCSTDAILPAWAFALVTAHAVAYCKSVYQGTKQEALTALYQQTLSQLDFSNYKAAPVILKGCAHKPVPNQVYTLAIQYLIPLAKSIMFGEACSAVPLFKAKK